MGRIRHHLQHKLGHVQRRVSHRVASTIGVLRTRSAVHAGFPAMGGVGGRDDDADDAEEEEADPKARQLALHNTIVRALLVDEVVFMPSRLLRKSRRAHLLITGADVVLVKMSKDSGAGAAAATAAVDSELAAAAARGARTAVLAKHELNKMVKCERAGDRLELEFIVTGSAAFKVSAAALGFSSGGGGDGRGHPAAAAALHVGGALPEDEEAGAGDAGGEQQQQQEPESTAVAAAPPPPLPPCAGEQAGDGASDGGSSGPPAAPAGRAEGSAFAAFAASRSRHHHSSSSGAASVAALLGGTGSTVASGLSRSASVMRSLAGSGRESWEGASRSVSSTIGSSRLVRTDEGEWWVAVESFTLQFRDAAMCELAASLLVSGRATMRAAICWLKQGVPFNPQFAVTHITELSSSRTGGEELVHGPTPWGTELLLPESWAEAIAGAELPEDGHPLLTPLEAADGPAAFKVHLATPAGLAEATLVPELLALLAQQPVRRGQLLAVPVRLLASSPGQQSPRVSDEGLQLEAAGQQDVADSHTEDQQGCEQQPSTPTRGSGGGGGGGGGSSSSSTSGSAGQDVAASPLRSGRSVSFAHAEGSATPKAGAAARRSLLGSGASGLLSGGSGLLSGGSGLLSVRSRLFKRTASEPDTASLAAAAGGAGCSSGGTPSTGGHSQGDDGAAELAAGAAADPPGSGSGAARPCSGGGAAAPLLAWSSHDSASGARSVDGSGQENGLGSTAAAASQDGSGAGGATPPTGRHELLQLPEQPLSFVAEMYAVVHVELLTFSLAGGGGGGDTGAEGGLPRTISMSAPSSMLEAQPGKAARAPAARGVVVLAGHHGDGEALTARERRALSAAGAAAALVCLLALLLLQSAAGPWLVVLAAALNAVSVAAATHPAWLHAARQQARRRLGAWRRRSGHGSGPLQEQGGGDKAQAAGAAGAAPGAGGMRLRLLGGGFVREALGLLEEQISAFKELQEQAAAAAAHAGRPYAAGPEGKGLGAGEEDAVEASGLSFGDAAGVLVSNPEPAWMTHDWRRRILAARPTAEERRKLASYVHAWREGVGADTLLQRVPAHWDWFHRHLFIRPLVVMPQGCVVVLVKMSTVVQMARSLADAGLTPAMMGQYCGFVWSFMFEVLLAGREHPSGRMVMVADMAGTRLGQSIGEGQVGARALGDVCNAWPERLLRCMVLGTPSWFNMLFRLVRPHLSPTTRAKVQVCDGAADAAAELARCLGGPELVPREYGGTCALPYDDYPAQRALREHVACLRERERERERQQQQQQQQEEEEGAGQQEDERPEAPPPA